ncbi:amidohydrolase family protein [Mariniphaga sediminis]|uniref:amidohydrolase family protein n=1 Tax=Mariniphaga sediminis TaxID=1628158 RepID=UPI0035674487
MTKRRDFIVKSVLGLTAGITTGSINLSAEPSTPVTGSSIPAQPNWQNDPHWRKIKYGDWGGPGVSSQPGPMDKILLKDWAPNSLVITQETFVPKAKYPAIDSHVHVVAKTPADIADWVKTMDEVGIETSVVLTHPAIGDDFAKLVKIFKKAYPGRFELYCGVDFTNFEKNDYPKRVVEQLERCHEMGACGVGEIHDKGPGFTKDINIPPNKRLHVDDERLDAFWEKCAELKMPVSLHVADHPSAWTPLDVFQERTPDYQHFSQYNRNVPSFDEMIEKRNKVLERHPNTIFIACHLGNQGHDLGTLEQAMQKYPNLYLDTSARDYELGRTPRSSAKFLNVYKDRIVFGTDMGRLKSMYQIHWRLLETDDEYIPGRVGWRYYGLDLPEATLKALYRDTAKKIFNI